MREHVRLSACPVTPTRIAACGRRLSYHFQINKNQKKEAAASDLPRSLTRLAHSARRVAPRLPLAARVRGGVFRKPRRSLIGQLVGPMRGRVRHAVNACACALVRLRAVGETKTRALRMGLEGGADLPLWLGLCNRLLRW